MKKTEILQQSAATSTAKRLERLASQAERLRQTHAQSVEELAAALEPLAQSLAALTDETRETLAELTRTSRVEAERCHAELRATTVALSQVLQDAQQAADRLNQARRRMDWRIYAVAFLVGLNSAALVTVSWLYLLPPEIRLDPQAVAEHLRPALTGLSKRFKGK